MKLQDEVGQTALQSRMARQGRNYELSKKSEEVNSLCIRVVIYVGLSQNWRVVEWPSSLEVNQMETCRIVWLTDGQQGGIESSFSKQFVIGVTQNSQIW